MCGIAPSLLEADYRQLGRELLRIERAGAEYVHLDIMDGNFVPNLSFGIKMIRGLRDSTNLRGNPVLRDEGGNCPKS